MMNEFETDGDVLGENHEVFTKRSERLSAMSDNEIIVAEDEEYREQIGVINEENRELFDALAGKSEGDDE